MANRADRYASFRLNLEQQGKRAKELLRAARAGDAAALSRFTAQPPRLAEAQRLIARDLRFRDWAELKRHVASMSVERAANEALDADTPTLHIRCGSDIHETLRAAGFQGDFLEHSHPYSMGPAHEGTDTLERQLAGANQYGRVVIWSEGDCFDQLVLLRLLGHFAVHRPPSVELINVGQFPGAIRFLGLGQLPPEALRLLWARREAVTAAQLSLGLAGWRALASDDPRALAKIMRTGTPPLPLLAPALHRHLRELPSVENALGFTQQMGMALLAKQPLSLERLFARITYEIDPLPGQGDLQVRDRLMPMGALASPLFTREPGVDGLGRSRPPWTDVLSATETGRAVLRGEADYLSLRPPPGWVGGVPIGPGLPDWRWDEAKQRPVLRPI